MILKKIEIENFKGISHLLFNPTKINIIVGKNNTGKTSILEAINTFYHKKQIICKNMSSFFNIYSKNQIINISISTDNSEEKISIQETQPNEIIKKFAKDVINIFLKELYSSSNSEKSIEFTDTVVKDLENVIIENINNDTRDFLYQNALKIIDQKGNENIYYLKNHSLVRKLEPILQKLIGYLKKVIPENVSQKQLLLRNLDFAAISTGYALVRTDKLDYEDSESEVIFKTSILSIFRRQFHKRLPKDSERLHKIEKTIKDYKLMGNLESLDFDNALFNTKEGLKAHALDFLGDGFKCIIAWLWLLSSKKRNSIVLFDEPEEHMHPGYIEKLVGIITKFSRDMNFQFFITTHSSDLLDTFLSNDLEIKDKEYIKKELTILKVDKINDSITIAESLDYKELLETKEDLLLDIRGV